METKEQKIKEIEYLKGQKQLALDVGLCASGVLVKSFDRKIKQREQELKELENTVLTCDEIQELTPEEYKRQTEKGND